MKTTDLDAYKDLNKEFIADCIRVMNYLSWVRHFYPSAEEQTYRLSEDGSKVIYDGGSFDSELLTYSDESLKKMMQDIRRQRDEEMQRFARHVATGFEPPFFTF